MASLNDDALNWFASDIAPKLNDIKWPNVREQFIARFGPAIANPLVESQHRRLKATETVQQYYDDKLRVLRRVTLTEPDVVAQLTEGMPPQYRGYLLCANPQTAVSWLAVTLQLESTIRRSQPFNRPTQQFKLKPNARQNAATQSAFVSARNSQNYSRNSRSTDLLRRADIALKQAKLITFGIETVLASARKIHQIMTSKCMIIQLSHPLQR